jgi:DNA (cytosine-5)-methyltransferase 1
MKQLTPLAHPIGLGHDFQPAPNGLYLPATHIPPPRPVAIDLFAGAGGFSLGMHTAGWHVAAAVEIDKHAAATYLCNLGSPDTRLHRLLDGQWSDERAGDVMPDLPGSGWIAARGAPWRPEDYPNDYLYEISKPPAADEPACEQFYLGDIRALTGQQILADLGRAVGEASAIIGGPPCQGFSMAGQRNVMDPRNSLVFEFCRLVLEVSPKTFVMENVPGLLSMVTAEGVPVIDAIALYLSRGGYAEYQALRRALAFDPAARAGIRAAPRSHSTADASPDDAEAEQLDLFGADR